jgi:hypothetical protein
MRAFIDALRVLAASPPAAAAWWDRTVLVPWSVRSGAGLAPLIEAFERQDVWLSSELARRNGILEVRETLLVLEIYTCYHRAAPSLVAAPFPPRLEPSIEVKAIEEALRHEFAAAAASATAQISPALSIVRGDIGPHSGEEFFLLATEQVAFDFNSSPR